MPQNTIAQHFAADGTPLHLLSVRNRIFRYLGYDNVHYLQDAPEYTERLASAAAPCERLTPARSAQSAMARTRPGRAVVASWRTATYSSASASGRSVACAMTW